MKSYRLWVLLSLCVSLLAASAAFSQISREELKRKYPNIKFHWMREAPYDQEDKREAEPSAQLPSLPESSSPSAEQIAVDEAKRRRERMMEEESRTISQEEERESYFVSDHSNNKYYILGEIGAGVYPMRNKSITLLDALYQAGFPYDGTSAIRRVQIITPGEEAPRERWVDVYTLLYKGRMKHNITMKPGTVIYVPLAPLKKSPGAIGQLSTVSENLGSIPLDLADFDARLVFYGSHPQQ